MIKTKRVEFILEWIGRMNSKFGSRVYGYGRFYDWGQALCVENYGKEPSDWPYWPSDDDIKLARQWEDGEFPNWLEPYKQ